MSVAKTGSDDRNCGLTNKDVLHQAICRLYKGGITVVAAAANESTSAAGLRPRGLQRGHHGVGPRGHRRQVRRPGREPLLLVGHVRRGRHVRRLQQLRLGCRHHRAGQMHLVDDSRAQLRVLVRDVDGRSGGHGRGRALQGEPPTGDSDRGARVAPLPRQLRLEDLDGPGQHPRAAARRAPRGGPRNVPRRRADHGVRRPTDRGHDRGARDGQPQLELLRAGSPQLQRRADRLVRHVGRDEPVRVDGQEHDGHDQGSRRRRRPARTRSRSSAPTGVARASSTVTVQVGAMPFTDVDDFDVQIEWLYQSRDHRWLLADPASARRARSPAPRWRCSSTARSTCRRPRPTTSTTTTARPAKAASTPWPRPRSPAAAARAGSARRPTCHPRPDGDVPRPRPGPAQRHDRLLRRRRRQDRRRQHQRPGAVRPSPAAAAHAATARRRSVTREQMAAFLYRAHLQGRLD